MQSKKGIGLACQYNIIHCQGYVKHSYIELTYSSIFFPINIYLTFRLHIQKILTLKEREQEEEVLESKEMRGEYIFQLLKIILVFVFKKNPILIFLRHITKYSFSLGRKEQEEELRDMISGKGGITNLGRIQKIKMKTIKRDFGRNNFKNYRQPDTEMQDSSSIQNNLRI